MLHILISSHTPFLKDVTQVMRKLKSNSASGPDNVILALFLKKILAHIANPLANLLEGGKSL